MKMIDIGYGVRLFMDYLHEKYAREVAEMLVVVPQVADEYVMDQYWLDLRMALETYKKDYKELCDEVKYNPDYQLVD